MTGEILNSNGWTPVTRERVFSGLNRKTVHDVGIIQDINENRNGLHVNENILENHEHSRNVNVPRFMNHNTNWDAKRSSSDILAEYKLIESADISRQNSKNKELQIVSSTERHRKAKAVSSTTHSGGYYDDPPQELFIKDTNINTNRYEVTENNHLIESLKNDKRDFEVNNDSGYLYDKFNETSADNIETNKNDFTATLLNILSSYNIRVNDVLPNYELSRGTTRRNPSKQQFLLLPIPIKYPNRYNSLDHLTVDPLLALFLSNYGIYLPGRYGLHNMYHNLYGHLASNNIHNNKPFGSYKMFADTDSSN